MYEDFELSSVFFVLVTHFFNLSSTNCYRELMLSFSKKQLKTIFKFSLNINVNIIVPFLLTVAKRFFDWNKQILLTITVAYSTKSH